ncbi:MAG: hypothetical protein HYZ22_05370 [Chloroflexi bacterium]|nr:hypothetical protein [Chloroflexota bacterium]
MATSLKNEKPTKREVFEMIREQIRHEDGLINQRLNWLLLSQAFLFAAFTTIITNDKQMVFINHGIQSWIPFGIAVTGIILNISSFVGLRTAYASLKNLRETWYEVNGEGRVGEKLKNGFPQITWVGGNIFQRAIATSTTMPWIVFSVWILLAAITIPIQSVVIWIIVVIVLIVVTIIMYKSTVRN